MKHELTRKKAAEMLGGSPSRISQLASNKQLDTVTINGSVRISEESVRPYAAESKQPGQPSRTSYAAASQHTLMNADYKVATIIYDSALDEATTRDLLSKMIICDVILANPDRRWRNFGFIRDINTLELRPAPILDLGNSLWYGKTDREVQASDWSFMPRPFARDIAEALACIDDVS